VAFGGVRRLRSGRYQARYSWPRGSGASHCAPSTFATERAALAWLRDEERLVELGVWTPPRERAAKEAAARAAGTTVGELVLKTVDRRARRARRPIAPTTADNYRRLHRLVIAPVLGDVRLSDLTRDMVQRWWDGLPDSPAQNGNAYDLLRSVVAEAVDDGLLERSPVRLRGAGKPAPRHRPVVLTPQGVAAYLRAAPGHRRAALAVALGCGLRSGEVRGLRRRDVDLEAGLLHVVQAVSRAYVDEHRREWRVAPPKTAAGVRTVPLPDWLADELRAWLDASPDADPDALAFPAGDGRSPLSEVSLHEAHKKAATAIGHPDMTVHDLRRTCLTLMEGVGAGLGVLKAVGGHTTAEMVLRYQAPGLEALRVPVDAVGALVAEALTGSAGI